MLGGGGGSARVPPRACRGQSVDYCLRLARLHFLAGLADTFCSIIEQVFVPGRTLLDLPPGTLEARGISTDLCSTTSA